MRTKSENVRDGNWENRSDPRIRAAAIGANDPERELAWRELIRRYRPSLEVAVRKVLSRSGIPCDPIAVEEVVGDIWYQLTKHNCKALKSWNPRLGLDLGGYLSMVGKRLAHTWCNRRYARREIQISLGTIVRVASESIVSLSPEQALRLKEAEATIAKWQSELTRSELALLRLWREGKNQAEIGLHLKRSQQYVSSSLVRLQERVRKLLSSVT